MISLLTPNSLANFPLSLTQLHTLHPMHQPSESYGSVSEAQNDLQTRLFETNAINLSALNANSFAQVLKLFEETPEDQIRFVQKWLIGRADILIPSELPLAQLSAEQILCDLNLVLGALILWDQTNTWQRHAAQILHDHLLTNVFSSPLLLETTAHKAFSMIRNTPSDRVVRRHFDRIFQKTRLPVETWEGLAQLTQHHHSFETSPTPIKRKDRKAFLERWSWFTNECSFITPVDQSKIREQARLGQPISRIFLWNTCGDPYHVPFWTLLIGKPQSSDLPLTPLFFHEGADHSDQIKIIEQSIERFDLGRHGTDSLLISWPLPDFVDYFWTHPECFNRFGNFLKLPGQHLDTMRNHLKSIGASIRVFTHTESPQNSLLFDLATSKHCDVQFFSNYKRTLNDKDQSVLWTQEVLGHSQATFPPINR